MQECFPGVVDIELVSAHVSWQEDSKVSKLSASITRQRFIRPMVFSGSSDEDSSSVVASEPGSAEGALSGVEGDAEAGAPSAAFT